MELHRHDPATGDMITYDPAPETELETAAAVTDASVRIAEIEAQKEITLAKIERGLAENLADTELDVLRAENAVLKEQLAALNPEPEQADPVVVVAEPESNGDGLGDDEAAETLTEPEIPSEPAAPRHKPAGLGMW
jgi:hypothetical protein